MGRIEMTPIEMAIKATQAMAQPGAIGVVLTIQKGKTPKGFPHGELLNEMERDGVVERTLAFNPEKVIGWLLRNGLVTMTREGNALRFATPPNEGEKNG
jgi:hypothetical protein